MPEWLKALISVSLIIGPTFFFGLVGKATEMGLSIVAGAIGAAFLNLDRVEHFKGAGFEARMKKVVDEAYATIDNVRAATVPLMIATLNNLTYANRWGGMNLQQKQALLLSLQSTAKDLSIKDNNVTAAFDLLHRFTTWDLFQLFKRSLEKDLPDSNLRISMGEKFQAILNYDSTTFPTEQQILNIVGEQANKMSNETKERLTDFLFYQTQKRLRRTNVNEEE